MTQSVASLLEQFEKLSEPERNEFGGIFIRRFTHDGIPGEITDGGIAEMGRRSFQRLDEDENAAIAR